MQKDTIQTDFEQFQMPNEGSSDLKYEPQVDDYVVWTTELGQVHEGWVFFKADPPVTKLAVRVVVVPHPPTPMMPPSSGAQLLPGAKRVTPRPPKQLPRPDRMNVVIPKYGCMKKISKILFTRIPTKPQVKYMLLSKVFNF